MLADSKYNKSIIPAQPTVNNKNIAKCNVPADRRSTSGYRQHGTACTVRMNEKGDTDDTDSTGDNNPSCGGNEFNLKKLYF